MLSVSLPAVQDMLRIAAGAITVVMMLGGWDCREAFEELCLLCRQKPPFWVKHKRTEKSNLFTVVSIIADLCCAASIDKSLIGTFCVCSSLSCFALAPICCPLTQIYALCDMCHV